MLPGQSFSYFRSSATASVQQILAGLDQPVTVQQLRKLCGLQTATVRLRDTTFDPAAT
jgi:hypothetical protein